MTNSHEDSGSKALHSLQNFPFESLINSELELTLPLVLHDAVASLGTAASKVETVPALLQVVGA